MHYWKKFALAPGHDLQVLYTRDFDKFCYCWPFVAGLKDSIRDAAAEVCSDRL